MCIAKNCNKDRIYLRSMCVTCYNKWKDAGSDLTVLDSASLSGAEKFRLDCLNGTVEMHIRNGLNCADLSERYGNTKSTIRR